MDELAKLQVFLVFSFFFLLSYPSLCGFPRDINFVLDSNNGAL